MRGRGGEALRERRAVHDDDERRATARCHLTLRSLSPAAYPAAPLPVTRAAPPARPHTAHSIAHKPRHSQLTAQAPHKASDSDETKQQQPCFTHRIRGVGGVVIWRERSAHLCDPPPHLSNTRTVHMPQHSHCAHASPRTHHYVCIPLCMHAQGQRNGNRYICSRAQGGWRGSTRPPPSTAGDRTPNCGPRTAIRLQRWYFRGSGRAALALGRVRRVLWLPFPKDRREVPEGHTQG